ncbi:TonB-dependent receptor [Methylosinus sp. PW1]|uniref:TonB-dependent receptor n=1 Tax=Methylosinus sp. PW1 TaxID=107636 RepID=UPI000A0597FA|nr:TonB-dependent receptor [Methylosinus sp. PW1]
MGRAVDELTRAFLSVVAPLALAAGAGFSSQLAFAEDAEIADVVVGARTPGLTRQEEKVLLSTPRSAAIVDGQRAEEEHLERLSDLSQLVPNYRPNIATARTSTPAIRGVGRGAGNGDSSELDTGFIVDNVFWKHVGFQWGDFIDLDSFEVGLGPQGTALGKNTTVGNIVLRTQLPSFERKATLETSFANYSHIVEKLNVTGPVIDDRLAYRLALYLDKGSGWIHDQVTGAGYLNNDRWGARGQLLYVGDSVTDRLIFYRTSSQEYIASNNHTGQVGDSVPIFANGTIGATYAQTLLSRLGRRVLAFDAYKPFNTRNGPWNTRTTTLSNELNWQLGDYTLTSISAWGEFTLHSHNALGIQETEITNVGGDADVYVDQFSQELRLASPRDQRLEWQAGLYSLYEKTRSYSHTDFGSNAAQWFGTPTTDPALLNGFQQRTDGKSRTFHIGGFGQGAFRLDDRWTLTLGLRDSYEIKEGSVFGWEKAWSQRFSPIQVYNAIRGGGGIGDYDTGSATKTRNMFTGIFNPSYKFSENILFHGLVGRGEKAAAVNDRAQPIWSGTTFKGFQPLFTRAETSWDYELGAKTNWLDGKLIANVSLYWADIFDFQANMVDTSYTDATGQPLRQTYLGSVPHVRLRGVEFTGRFSPIERLWISFNGAYTEARYIDYANAAPPADWIWSTPSPTPVGFIRAPLTLSRSNSRWENLPKWAVNIGATYDHPLGPALRDLGPFWDRPVTAFGYANLAWQDRTQLTSPWSVRQYWQPAYSIVNAGLGLRTDDERYSLSIWAKNVFDQRYITAWSPGSSTTATTIQLQDFPRSVGGTLLVKLY